MSKDVIGVQGYFHFQTWDQDKLDYLKTKGIEVTGGNLLAAGFNPNSDYFNKNLITDEGYNWIRGQLLGDPAYGSKMGEILFTFDYASNETREFPKKVIRSAGRKHGEIVYEASWDATEIADREIYKVHLQTYTDSTTPAGAAKIYYAEHNLAAPFFKRYGEALTVTRYEYFQNK